MLSSLFWWVTRASGFFWLTEIKEKQSEKMFIKWEPRENSLFKMLKEENTLFN